MRWRVHALRRAGCAGLLVALAQTALAQTAAGAADAGRQFEGGRSAELQQWQWRAQRGIEATPAQAAVQRVLEAIQQRDCAAAVAGLNAGLAQGHPEIFTLAGALYEEGVCVRQNWQRAEALYQRALAVQHPGVAPRLAAAYASAVGGRDKAATLWWAVRARTALPAPCASVAPLADDADKFIAALQAWPVAQIEHCTYAAAVMASVQAELEQPDFAASYGMVGTVVLNFVPAQGRIAIQDDGVDAPPPATGALTAGSSLDLQRSAARRAFQTQLRRAADRALKRYEPPAGLPADWRVETRHVFQAPR